MEFHLRAVVKDLLKSRSLSRTAAAALEPTITGSRRLPYKGLQSQLSLQASAPYDAVQREERRQKELHRIITKNKGSFAAGGKTRVIDGELKPISTGDPYVDTYANPMLIRGVPRDQRQLDESAYTRKPLFVTHPERPFYTKPGGNRSTVRPNDLFDAIADAERTGGATQRHLGMSVRFGVSDNADTRMVRGDDGFITQEPVVSLRATAKVPTRPK